MAEGVGLYVIAAAVLAGFGYGFFRARARGGGLADALQWGVGHAVVVVIAGVVAVFVLGLLGIGTPEG